MNEAADDSAALAATPTPEAPAGDDDALQLGVAQPATDVPPGAPPDPPAAPAQLAEVEEELGQMLRTYKVLRLVEVTSQEGATYSLYELVGEFEATDRARAGEAAAWKLLGEGAEAGGLRTTWVAVPLGNWGVLDPTVEVEPRISMRSR